MSDGSLIAGLIAAAYGLALSRADRRTVRLALPLFGAVAAIAMVAAQSRGPLTPVVGAAGVALAIGLALVALLPKVPGLAMPTRAMRISALLAGVSAGLLAGAFATGAGRGLAWTLPLPALLAVPGHLAATTGRLVVVRVAASWVLTVGVLATTLALAPVTAGNAVDHME